MNKLISLLSVVVIVVCGSCSKPPETEKYQYKRNHIIEVRDKLVEIEIDSLLFSSASTPYIIDNYLLIADYKSYDHLIRLFDKNTFHFQTGIALWGQGPGEISSMGYIGVDESRLNFEVTDFGKQAVFCYNLDSVLTYPSYMPWVKTKIHGDKLLHKYQYIGVDQTMGLLLEPMGSSDYKVSVGKQDIHNGKFEIMPYTHPEIKKKRVSFAVSPEYGIYVECYEGQNLMTICSLDGKLKYNIYGGKNWRENQRGRIEFFRHVAFANDKIVALYLEDHGVIEDPVRGMVENQATKFLVFDLKGDYMATLETGYRIRNFCYDKENNRIILSMNDEIQFAYLDLDGLI